jgi:hypothetical protein
MPGWIGLRFAAAIRGTNADMAIGFCAKADNEV